MRNPKGFRNHGLALRVIGDQHTFRDENYPPAIGRAFGLSAEVARDLHFARQGFPQIKAAQHPATTTKKIAHQTHSGTSRSGSAITSRPSSPHEMHPVRLPRQTGH